MKYLANWILLGCMLSFSLAAAEARAEDAPKKAGEGKGEARPRNVRLTFALVPLEGEDKPHPVLCAGGTYAYGVTHKGRDEQFSMSVQGEMEFAGNPKTVKVTYDAAITWQTNDEEWQVRSAGSALLRYSETRSLAVLGEKELLVTATIADTPQVNRGKGEPAPDPEPEKKRDRAF